MNASVLGPGVECDELKRMHLDVKLARNGRVTADLDCHSDGI